MSRTNAGVQHYYPPNVSASSSSSSSSEGMSGAMQQMYRRLSGRDHIDMTSDKTFDFDPYHCAENGQSRSPAQCRVDFFILSGLVLPVVGRPWPERSSAKQSGTVMRPTATLTVLSTMAC